VTGFVTPLYASLPRISGGSGNVSKRILFDTRSGGFRRAEQIKQLQAVADKHGIGLADVLFAFVGQHLSKHLHDPDNKQLQEELEAFRKQHGEFETHLQSTDNIHLLKGKPKH
jgi:hypothetical protein